MLSEDGAWCSRAVVCGCHAGCGVAGALNPAATGSVPTWHWTASGRPNSSVKAAAMSLLLLSAFTREASAPVLWPR